MPSASNTSNSSNIRSKELKISVQKSNDGSRLLVNLRNERSGFLAPGLTAGDVIYYDVSLSGYTRSVATALNTSEVFGVVESVNEDGSLDVVTYGSINYPANRLLNISGPNFGGNDVYFLSDNFPGRLQNLAPSTIGYVVKPVYQIAPHSPNFTGSVMNYVGYTIIDVG
jgi:hypothetical protein